jgi:enoyl-[acyl-carrier protein] reductase II
LTRLLGIEHPVMLAGMGGVSYHRLAAAVSEAGGFGCLGAATMTTTQMVDEIRAMRALTPKPFGIDLLTALPTDMAPQVEVAAGEGMTLFVAGLGIPAGVIDLCHDRGVQVGSMCGTVDHALRAVEAGCDLVIAQGTEAGGHTGRVATLPLVPQVVDAVGRRVPVVAAGGIVDGRGLAAALALGADGVWVGTRFVATPEARTVPGFKEVLLSTSEDGTVVTRAYTGKTLRAVRNAFTDYYEAHPEEIKPFPYQAAQSVADGVFHLGDGEGAKVDPDRECFPAGQGVGKISELVPAGEVVATMVAEAESVLRRLYTLS